jgi:hypothetical protein
VNELEDASIPAGTLCVRGAGLTQMPRASMAHPARPLKLEIIISSPAYSSLQSLDRWPACSFTPQFVKNPTPAVRGRLGA